MLKDKRHRPPVAHLATPTRYDCRMQLKRLHSGCHGFFRCLIVPSQASAAHVLCLAMQAGTSHDLGDNFAKAFGTQFLNEAGDLVHPQQSSWGASTRLIGGIIMTHGALL